jgi:DNA repair photolyase
MNSFLVLKSFEAKTPTGCRIWKRGEAIRLSSTKAASMVASGFIVERNVGGNLLTTYEARVKTLRGRVGNSAEEARIKASALVISCIKRHESTKTVTPPSEEFLAEVEASNRTTQGKNPILKEKSETGVGEWAGYTCNIGTGCTHGCRYCYAEKMAVRFGRITDSEAWQEENLRDVSTEGCKKYDSTIMFPTTHDISPAYLPAYRVHLYNLLEAGNKVLVVSKPHYESIKALCTEFSSFRDNIMFRFTIGGLDGEVMRHWEPGAPPIEERLQCLKYAFEQGYTTSVSAEPMLGGREEAVKLYNLLEPYITKEIWFGKMNNIGGFRNSDVPEVARHAKELLALQTDDEIMELVGSLGALVKVQWKDSIKEIITKRAGGNV